MRYRWSSDTVLSCVMGRGEESTIDFIFDTTRKDRQNRTYFVEKEDAQVIFLSSWNHFYKDKINHKKNDENRSIYYTENRENAG